MVEKIISKTSNSQGYDCEQKDGHRS